MEILEVSQEEEEEEMKNQFTIFYHVTHVFNVYRECITFH